MLQVPQEGTCTEILPFKSEVATVEGQPVAMAGQGPTGNQDQLPEGLIGEVDIAKVCIEGIECKGLVDTGASVTTVSQKFYTENLLDLPLHPLNSLLKIECASGEYLPYLGYIEANITIGEDVSGCFPILVVPDTAYSADVPIVLGTNVLRPLMKKSREVYGERFLQEMETPTPWWLAFRRIGIQDRQEKRHDGKVGMVRCAIPEKITIPGNGRVMVPATITNRIPATEPLMLLHPTEKSVLPDQATITPAVLMSAGTDDGEVQVEVCNLGTTPDSATIITLEG